VGADGKAGETMVSVKAEAQRIVGHLPKAGMDLYKLTYGPKAAEELKVAKSESDAKLLGQIMPRYLYTDAGAEATELPATYLLDRGQYSTSALCFERLFHRAGPKKLAPMTLFKAAIAFQHTGDKHNQEIAWKEIESKNNGPMTIGNR